MAGLILKNISKKYNIQNKPIIALENINLNIPDGSFITIVGKSGSGKTTLLRLICGLEEKTTGEISFSACSLCSQPRISVVFQEPRLMPWLTVKENMAFPLRNVLRPEEAEIRVQNYLDLLGMTAFQQAYPSQISGGMAQRVALGRTLCYDPDIVLMDEPLGSLDAFNRRKLQREILSIYHQQKKTIILVTHDVDEAVFLGDKVVVIDNGRIVQEVDIKLIHPRKITSHDFVRTREKILNNILKGD